VNFEYFERDHLEHKDRETYARLHWSPGLAALTLTAKPHVRDFVTETEELPQAGLWVASLPILASSVAGGPALDLSTVTRAGYLKRRFDEDLATDSYGAWRVTTETLANLAFSLGDMRVSSWAGLSGAGYLDRDDGGEDLARTALLAGARANLQFHRTFAARGGPFELDGLRHVVDADLGFAGRFLDTADPSKVPFFDLEDAEEERSVAQLALTNRLQTRDRGGVRTLVDLETALRIFPDEIGPDGRDTPGEVDIHLRGEPAAGWFVGGDGDFDFHLGNFEHAGFGVGVIPAAGLSVAAGARFVKGESFAPGFDLSWRWSEKYGLRWFQAYEFGEGENITRLLLRRYSPDHVILFGISLRGDDVDFEFSINPAIGGVPEGSDRGFRDQPDLDPWGAFPWLGR
jgi:hypothetical protein